MNNHTMRRAKDGEVVSIHTAKPYPTPERRFADANQRRLAAQEVPYRRSPESLLRDQILRPAFDWVSASLVTIVLLACVAMGAIVWTFW